MAYKFCPECGASNQRLVWPFECQNCGKRYYPPSHNGVALILWRPDGKVMGIERGTDPIGGLAFVSGYSNLGEVWEFWQATAVRVLRQETEIVLPRNRVQYVAALPVQDGQLFFGEASLAWDEYDQFRPTVEARRQVALWPHEAAKVGALCFPAHTRAMCELIERNRSAASV